MKLGMVSLGCPKNLVDSEVMLGIIRDKNLEVTNNPEEADIIIVNTCGFIESAREESVNAILSMGEYKNEGNCKYLIVTGCLSQRYADELLEEMPEVDAVVGTEAYTDIAYVIDQVLSGKRIKLMKPVESLNVKMPPRMLTTPSYMAYLKIAEGCDNFCSYCIIPFLRGRYKSEPYEKVLAEAKALAEAGVKELIVVAQDTTLYGKDLYGKLMLPQLLRDLNQIEGLKWIRVMYLYPNNFTDELIEAIRDCEKVCKYIDIPLQHASNPILKSMNRHETKAEIETLLAKLRKEIPNITIRTTFMVGYPGETEEDFATLKSFVAEQRFENAGVFEYSQEENTFAGKMLGQIEPEVKEERFHELMALQAEISEEIHRDREDQELEVLIEGFMEDEPDKAIARSMHEAPDIDGSIFIENAEGLEVGKFYTVRIVQGFTYEMVAELV